MQLIADQGTLAGQTYPLQVSRVVIGRGADSDLVLLEQGVSRHHACLERGPQGWLLTDLGSTNGTYVNDSRVHGPGDYLLRAGDRIRIGSSVLVFDPGEDPGSFQVRGRYSEPTASARFHPALLAMAAVVLIAALVGVVFLLVTVLQPAELPPTATAVEPLDHLKTALPLPTGLDEIVTSIAPLLPTGLSLPRLGGTPTPTP